MAVDKMSQDLNAAFSLRATLRHNEYSKNEIGAGSGRVVHPHCNPDYYRERQSLNILNI